MASTATKPAPPPPGEGEDVHIETVESEIGELVSAAMERAQNGEPIEHELQRIDALVERRKRLYRTRRSFAFSA